MTFSKHLLPSMLSSKVIFSPGIFSFRHRTYLAVPNFSNRKITLPKTMTSTLSNLSIVSKEYVGKSGRAYKIEKVLQEEEFPPRRVYLATWVSSIPVAVTRLLFFTAPTTTSLYWNISTRLTTMTSNTLIISYAMGETTCVSPRTLFLSSQCLFLNTLQIISYTSLRRTCRLKQGKRFSKMRLKGLQNFMTMILSTQVPSIGFSIVASRC